MNRPGHLTFTFLPAHLDIFFRFKFSIKNLTGNNQKWSTRSFLQYLNEASDVLNLVISSDFLLEASVNSLSLWPYNYSQVDTEHVFLSYNNNVSAWLKLIAIRMYDRWRFIKVILHNSYTIIVYNSYTIKGLQHNKHIVGIHVTAKTYNGNGCCGPHHISHDKRKHHLEIINPNSLLKSYQLASMLAGGWEGVYQYQLKPDKFRTPLHS